MPRFARVLMGIALLIGVILIILWLQRKPIADSFVRDELRKRGVPAQYRIANLGLSTQRLEDVVIGNPAHPDLVADWVEIHTDLSLSGAEVLGISAGHVRIRGALQNGTLSLGAIDKLMPAPSGKPFSLPSINVRVEDARMHLETAYGVAGLKLTGEGRLDNGFHGTLAAVSPQMAVGGCSLDRLAGVMKIAVSDQRPSVQGPLRAAGVHCDGLTVDRFGARVDGTLNAQFDRWQGGANLDIGRIATKQAKAAAVNGNVTFSGGAKTTQGTLDIASGAFSSAMLAGKTAKIEGRYRAGSAGNGFAGVVAATGATLPKSMLAKAEGLKHSGDGTPVAPLLAKLGDALIRAGRSADFSADLSVDQQQQGGLVQIRRAMLHSASGADVTVSGGEGVRYHWPDGAMTLDGLVSMAGGGLPGATVRLHQRAPNTPVTGIAIMDRYSAGNASIALTPVTFSASPDGSTRLSTELTLSGPLGDGEVDRLRLPLNAYWDGGTRLVVNRDCVPAGFDRLAISGLALDAAKVRLCPAGDALVRIAGSRVSGGARIGAPDLTGHIGSTPLRIGAGTTEFRLTDNGFALSDVKARLGQPDNVTRIDAANIAGHITGGGAVSGTFGGAAGQIGAVPLVMSDAVGDWRLKNGVLTLNGGLTLSDAAESPRFKPLASDDFTMTLAGNEISAKGTLKTPEAGVKVADVTLSHDLSRGAGKADLVVPGITFKPDGLQPDTITPLTLGVVANVDGTLTGEGHIAWNGEGVTSTGDFHTAGTNLAAAFGTVSGLSTDLHFTDLLGLVSSPGQVATIAEVNPGIAAQDGVFHYQLTGEQRVRVEDGHWPFAGGDLTLDDTVLDFGGDKAKHFTFHVKGMEAAQFLQQFDFDNLSATGTFDGVLPMIFDADGGRIEGGHLDSREGGTLAYVGEVSQKDLGYWGNYAFQALRSLRYDSLSIDMNGPLAGSMVTQIRFAGVKQGEGAKSNFLTRRIAKLPLLFNVTIRAPFRQLIDSVQSYYDPSRLIERNLPTLLEEQGEDAAGAKQKDSESRDQPENVQAGESRDMQ